MTKTRQQNARVILFDQADEVRMFAAAVTGVDWRDVGLHGASHEGLPKGSASINCEGSGLDSWARTVCDKAYECGGFPGVFLEPINNCIVGIYYAD